MNLEVSFWAGHGHELSRKRPGPWSECGLGQGSHRNKEMALLVCSFERPESGCYERQHCDSLRWLEGKLLMGQLKNSLLPLSQIVTHFVTQSNENLVLQFGRLKTKLSWDSCAPTGVSRRECVYCLWKLLGPSWISWLLAPSLHHSNPYFQHRSSTSFSASHSILPFLSFRLSFFHFTKTFVIWLLWGYSDNSGSSPSTAFSSFISPAFSFYY